MEKSLDLIEGRLFIFKDFSTTLEMMRYLTKAVYQAIFSQLHKKKSGPSRRR